MDGKNGENHQVGIREKPALGTRSAYGGAGHRSEVLFSSEVTEILARDASETGDFSFSEVLLARLNSDHP